MDRPLITISKYTHGVPPLMDELAKKQIFF